jgi:hypothetical protein
MDAFPTQTRRLLTAAAACCLLLACASKTPATPAQNRCPPNRPGCQIEVVFANVGFGERVARLDARLSAAQPDAIYLFTADAGETLRLKLSGAPVHLILTRPNGQSEGPGLPAEMVLKAKGRYVLGVAASKTADDAYGEFQLEMRLSKAP